MKNTQSASAMPIHKYRPYHEIIAVDLPDRTYGTDVVQVRSALAATD